MFHIQSLGVCGELALTSLCGCGVRIEQEEKAGEGGEQPFLCAMVNVQDAK